MREFSIFHLSKLEWDASKIGIKSNGGWAVFTDPVTHKSINSPRRPCPEPKITYRRKTEEQLEQEEKARQWREIRTKKKGNNFNNFSTVTNPLLNPPKDNYKEFKARKQLISTKNSNSEFDDTISYANGALSSRSMPRKPQKTMQLARNLQVTSLNTQRNYFYSRTSAAKCTPRSLAASIQYCKSDENLNDNEEEEETNYEDDIKFCDNKKNSENEEENIIQNDDEINKVETEILNISMNSASSINSNESDNKTQNEKDHKSTLENLDENETNVDNEEDYYESENNEKDSLNDDVERIEIKADLISDQTNDSSKNEQEIKNDINESKEKNVDKDETKTELNNNSTIKLWKKKRTGEVISRKRIVITSNISSDNEKKDNPTAEKLQESKENKFNHIHPNDKPIHYNFKYNHPNNLRKSEIPRNYNKKQKKEIKINKKSTKIASKNPNSIHNNKQKINEIDYEKNKIKSESEKLNIDKKENNAEVNNDGQNKNIKNENIENEPHNDINKNSDNQNNNNLNNNAEDSEENNDQNQLNEIENEPHNNINKNSDNKTNNNLNNNAESNEENNDQNQLNEIENSDKTSIDDNQKDSSQISNDEKNSIQIDPAVITNNNEEEEQRDSNEIIISDNDNDQINSITTLSDNEQTNASRENKNSVKNNSNENIEFENTESITESFLTNCDSYDGYIESNATSITSKNAKKVSNVYGHNYNDYNYYNNVLTANTKANVASGAPFQFSSTRKGSISSCEISHNLSPLPSTRRPATAIKQRFIERPECIRPERYFKGDDPAPARRFFQSASLVAEMRREEEMKLIQNAQVKTNLSKTVSKKSLSLYERSLKPREKRYCWPRDFAQFSVE